MLFLCRHSMHVGIVACDQQYRAVAVKKIKNRLQVCSMVIVEINDEHNPGAKKNALMKVREALNYQSGPVIMALNYDEVISKRIEVDSSLSDEELLYYLHHQSPHIFGCAASEITVDFSRLGKFDKSMQSVQIAAAKRDVISKLMILFQSCGFDLRAIEVDIFAATRLIFMRHNDNNPNAYYAVILFQQQQLVFFVLYQHRLIYTVTVDYPLKTALHQAFHFFRNANATECQLSKIMVMGEPDFLELSTVYLKKHAYPSVEVACSDIENADALDPRLLVSLGAALQRFSH